MVDVFQDNQHVHIIKIPFNVNLLPAILQQQQIVSGMVQVVKLLHLLHVHLYLELLFLM